MQSIESIFTQAKSWQMFIVLFGIPMVIQFGLMYHYGERLTATGLTQEEMIEGFERLAGIISIASFVYGTLMIGWLYFVGTAANKRIEIGGKKSIFFFRFSALYPLLYMIFFFAVFMGTFIRGNTTEVFYLVLPFHFLAMFCMFYLLYFASRNLSQAFDERGIQFVSTIGLFLGFWFYPIGVWFIQPKVNRLVRNESALKGQ